MNKKNVNIDNQNTITVKTEKVDSRWATIDNNNITISEGATPEEAITIAEKVTNDFMVVFVPEEGATYIF